jgi:hypothetical protein
LVADVKIYPKAGYLKGRQMKGSYAVDGPIRIVGLLLILSQGETSLDG